MAKYLFLYTISPVQSFISQARKTKDLKAGSDILSDLISYAIESIKGNNPLIIFPAEKNASKPNRFIAELDFDTEIEVSEFGETLSNRIREKFKNIAVDVFNNVCKNADYPSNFEQQIEDFLEVYWAALPLGENYLTTYSEIERLLASVKNVKSFRQIDEKGRKCSICGERNGLFYSPTKKGKQPVFTQEDALRLYDLKTGETLCAVCFVKRNYKKTEMDFPSTADIALMGNYERIVSTITDDKVNEQLGLIKKDEPTILLAEKLKDIERDSNASSGLKDLEVAEIWQKFTKTAKDNKLKISSYYGLLMFDGDRMGEWLSGVNLEQNGRIREFHENFTEKLGGYAAKAQNYLDSENRGKTVYAGGDDFLGFLNLEKIFSTLHELRMMFDREVNQPLAEAFSLKKPITFSAGITIAHYKTPLRIVLQRTRDLEKKAKEAGDRNAFAISVMKHSGEILETYLKWFNIDNTANINTLSGLLKKLSSGDFSSNFIRVIQQEFCFEITADVDNKDAFKAELERLAYRSCNLNKEDKRKAVEEMMILLKALLKNTNYSKVRYYNLLNILLFILRDTTSDWEVEL